MQHQRPRLGSLAVAMTLAVGAVVAVAAPAAAAGEVGAPVNLRVPDLHSDRLTVEWDGTGEPIYYHVKLFNGSAASHFKSVIAHSVQPAAFTGLQWSWDYRVVVTAVYPGATSALRYADSEPLHVRTTFPDHCGHPTAPPNLRSVLDDQGRVETLRWDASEVGCSRLTYRLHADGVGQVVVNPAQLDVYDANLHHPLFVSGILTPGETYTFTVTATDIRGNVSPPGAPLTVTVPTDLPPKELTPPGNLRTTVGDDGRAERLDWEPSTGGSGVIVYEVEYRFGNEQSFSVFFTVQEPFVDIKARIGLLLGCPANAHPASTMIFRIVARSGVLRSAPSNEVSFCLP